MTNQIARVNKSNDDKTNKIDSIINKYNIQ